MNFRNLEDFWAFYVSQHSKRATRHWHFVGTFLSLLFLLCSFLFSWWFLLCVPLSGYGCAWYSHFFVEKNVPATFGHPFWSFLCDYKMFGLMLTGQMDREIKRLGKRPVLQGFWFMCDWLVLLVWVSLQVCQFVILSFVVLLRIDINTRKLEAQMDSCGHAVRMKGLYSVQNLIVWYEACHHLKSCN